MVKFFMKSNKILKIFNIICLSIAVISLLVLGIQKIVNSQKAPEQLALVQNRGKLIVGTKFDSKPFGFVDKDGKLKGFDVDLSRELAKRLLGSPEAIEFKKVTSSNRIFTLTAGEIDFIAATMTINDKRKKVVDFSTPYYVAGEAIMVPKGSSIYGITDLNNKKVGVVMGSTSEDSIRDIAPVAIIIGFKTYPEVLNSIKSGKLDAIMADDTILKEFVTDNTGYKVLNRRYTEEPYGLAYRKDQDSYTFQDEVNQALEDIKADGTLNMIKHKWIKN